MGVGVLVEHHSEYGGDTSASTHEACFTINTKSSCDYSCEKQKKINHALMSHLNVWKVSNSLALKFLQIIDGMNVRQEREHNIHLRTHAII